MLHTLTAPRGMVSAPHHLAAEAGLSVLRDGGNPVEAAVAAAATIAVVYPHMNSIGGDGFWLIARPGSAPIAIDACGRAAALATIDFYRAHGCSEIPSRGPLAANTVAGAVSGWQLALGASGGRLPLSRLLRDAIWYAANGVGMTENQVAYTSRFFDELCPQSGFAPTYLEDGEVPRAGSLRRYPRLASVLERLAARGLDDFYRGEIGTAIGDECERLGSPLRASDLAQHRASLVTPLSLRLKVGTLYNLPPPTQGLASLVILGIFERLGCTAPDGFEHVHGLVEATKQAFLIRDRYVCDPDAMRAEPSDFLSGQALGRCADAIDTQRARPWPEAAAKGDTVWLGAADHQGNMASYIQSVYWEFGSGVVLDSIGATWQNRGSSFTLDPGSLRCLAPGRKPFHTLNPACAHLDDGRTMVYGTMGGDGQPQTQAAIFTRYAMFGQPLQQALTAPRWLLGRTWGKESVTLKLESRFAPQTLEALARAGHEVEPIDAFSDLVGHAGALVVCPRGVIAGAADPRSDGSVAGC
jgi:oxamate amidohydrolase